MVEIFFPPAEKCHFGVFWVLWAQFLSLEAKKGCFCAYLGELFLDCGVRIKKYLQMITKNQFKVCSVTTFTHMSTSMGCIWSHRPRQKPFKTLQIHCICIPEWCRVGFVIAWLVSRVFFENVGDTTSLTFHIDSFSNYDTGIFNVG